MAKQTINIGTTPGDHTGDPVRTAFDKCNDNFDELYNVYSDTARTPSSASAEGKAGEVCWDSDYLYVCTATNTWKRTSISTW